MTEAYEDWALFSLEDTTMDEIQHNVSNRSITAQRHLSEAKILTQKVLYRKTRRLAPTLLQPHCILIFESKPSGCDPAARNDFSLHGEAKLQKTYRN